MKGLKHSIACDERNGRARKGKKLRLSNFTFRDPFESFSIQWDRVGC